MKIVPVMEQFFIFAPNPSIPLNVQLINRKHEKIHYFIGNYNFYDSIFSARIFLKKKNRRYSSLFNSFTTLPVQESRLFLCKNEMEPLILNFKLHSGISALHQRFIFL